MIVLKPDYVLPSEASDKFDYFELKSADEATGEDICTHLNS